MMRLRSLLLYFITGLSFTVLEGCSGTTDKSLVEEIRERATREDDTWGSVTGTVNDQPLFTRYLRAIPKGIDTSGFPFLMVLTWTYDSINSEGLPSLEEYNRMERLERDLLVAVQQKGIAVLVITSVGSGFRDWLWYARSDKEMVDAARVILDTTARLPITMDGTFEPGWSTYTNYIESLRDSTSSTTTTSPE